MANEEIRRAENVGKKEGRRLETRHWVAITLAVLILIFALLNLDEVPIDFAVKTVRIPLIFVIAIVGAIGVGVGWLLRSRGRDD
jgi:uncharacterized integral membrane protein